MTDPYLPYSSEDAIPKTFAQKFLYWAPLIGDTAANKKYTEAPAEACEKKDLMGKLKFWDRAEGLRDSLTEKIENAQEAAENYKMGVMLLCIGGLILF
jgi:hypothetical protein